MREQWRRYRAELSYLMILEPGIRKSLNVETVLELEGAWEEIYSEPFGL